MKFRDLTLLTVISLALSAGPVQGGGVVILGAPDTPSWNNDVQSTILASGVALGGVSIIDVATSTPSLATLETFSAVLVYTDGVFTQNGPLGDVLASYVNAGHGVVQMTFANASLPLGGAWDSGGYNAIAPTGQTEGTELTLGTINAPGNPLFNGVTSFDGGTSSFHSTGGVANGATLLAQWSDGSVFAAELTDKAAPIISLNFFPPSNNVRSDFWVSSTNGGLLMANALAEVAGLNAVPEPTSVVMGGISVVMILGVGLRSRRRAA
jgi:hypothetical protein